MDGKAVPDRDDGENRPAPAAPVGSVGSPGEPGEPPPEADPSSPRVSLWAHATGDARIYQAARDQYIYEAPASSRRVPPAGSPTAALVDQILVGFEPPPALEGLVARVRQRRWTSVIGAAGSGKTALLTALARRELCLGRVPEDFVQALVYCDATTTVESLALDLRNQLLVSVPGYEQHLAGHAQADPDGWQQQDGIGRYVQAPLARLDDDVDEEVVVRLVIDGLDLLEGDAAEKIPARLSQLAADNALSGIRLVVSHREPQPHAPPAHAELRLDATPADTVTRYLRARRIATDVARLLAGLCCRGSGAWLAARLLADTYNGLDATQRRDITAAVADPTERAAGLGQLWERRLDQVPGWTRRHPAGSDEPDEPWMSRLRPVLTVLAAAGSGAVMPIAFLAAVAAEFGGPDQPSGVRAVLDQLGDLVLHTQPGTEEELVGLFHPALVEHLAKRPSRRLDISSGRRVLLLAIDRHAPVTGLYTDNPLYRWSAAAEAEHYWQSGMPIAACDSLRRRPLRTPRQNLDRWTAWLPRFHSALGPTHRYTLGARSNIAGWTGETGDPAEALRLFRELLPDRDRVLGPDDPDTLGTRNNIAAWTGETGDPAEALRLARELLPDMVRALGLGHPDTLTTRNNIAAWTGQTGDPAEALRLARELLPDRERVLGLGHPDTLATRNNIAFWTGQIGQGAEALRLFRELLPDIKRVLGPGHPDTLTTRNNIAGWTGETGQGAEALRLFRELLPDRERVLGPSHPDTLTTRSHIAFWTGQAGDPAEALRLFRELLPDTKRVLGPGHPDTLTTRKSIARWEQQLKDGTAGAS